ncbi:restriction endonuclease [Bacillus sp. MYb56]|uniref:restriction endonuclease n=1 Tax=Bacillus sp. MYb56 TaxID=1827287 RepID=UPI000CFCA76D|nr:restriction endonuclease [Bacillus sp. MYb56]PRD10419.1 restriction endonuclease [Bacillus sp. MYb56]
MSIPKHQDVRLPLLKSLEDGIVHTLKECVVELVDYFQLTKEERHELLPQTNRTKIYDRVYWAKTHLNMAGLIESLGRGKFRITQEGNKLLKQNFSEIEDIHLEQYPEYVEFLKRSGKKFISKSDNSVSSSIAVLEKNYEKIEDTPNEIVELAFKELNIVMAEELLEKLKEMDYFKFEYVVLEVLERLGYGPHKQVTKRTADGGIDGIISDVLGLNKIFVQAKRWSDTSINERELQRFSGALDGVGGDKGVFITTSFFVENAQRYIAKLLPNKKIVLIDGLQLAQYMIETGLGVSVAKVYEIKRLNLEYFTEE